MELNTCDIELENLQIHALLFHRRLELLHDKVKTVESEITQISKKIEFLYHNT